MVKLAPKNPAVEEDGVRTALYGAGKKPVQSLQTLADHLRNWHNLYVRYGVLPDVVVDDKALKAVLEIMVQPVLLVADGKGVTLSQQLFFAQGIKQMTKVDSSATLTLQEYYDVAIQFAQAIPHPKPVALKLFYTSSDQPSDRGDGPDKQGGKGGKGGKGKGPEDNSGRVKRLNTLDGTPTSGCL